MEDKDLFMLHTMGAGVLVKEGASASAARDSDFSRNILPSEPEGLNF